MKSRFLKCKLHRATVTDANLEYEGSITIDRDLIEVVGLRFYESVDIYNISNGERFSTYVIPGDKGQICLNGAAAWKAKPGDKIIIAAYCDLDESEISTHKPRVVLLGDENLVRSIS